MQLLSYVIANIHRKFKEMHLKLCKYYRLSSIHQNVILKYLQPFYTTRPGKHVRVFLVSSEK